MKKLLAILVSLSLFFSITTFAYNQFWDVPHDYWAYNYITELSNRGIINGYENNAFSPENAITRAELAKLLVTAGNIDTKNVYVHLALENCEDLSKNHWAAVYMVASNKYLPPVNKDGITYYYPERLATREEVIVSIAKLKGIKKTDTSILNQFTDTNFMSNSSKDYIAAAINKGWINGYDDHTIRTDSAISRAEISALLCRAFEIVSDNKIY